MQTSLITPCSNPLDWKSSVWQTHDAHSPAAPPRRGEDTRVPRGFLRFLLQQVPELQRTECAGSMRGGVSPFSPGQDQRRRRVVIDNEEECLEARLLSGRYD